MALTLRDYQTIIDQMVAAAQAECTELTDLTPGSPMLALLQAGALNTLYLQLLAVEVAKVARLTTSTGTDVDTWAADFDFDRLPSVAATGTVTFSRYLTTNAATIAVGSMVKTEDGTAFLVTQDTDNALWNVGAGAYVIPSGVASGTLPVEAVVAGVSGNVRAGTITVIASPIAGVDSVTNAAAFINGVDPEDDAALKKRFIHYINTRSQATNGAIEYAIANTQQGLSYKVVENKDPSGAAQAGFFTVYVDDGSGEPSDDLLADLRSNIDAVRPISVTFAVLSADVVTANVSVNITAKPGYDKKALLGPVAAAIQDYINGLGVGVPLSFYRLAHVAQDNVEGVESISGLTLNGNTRNVGGAVNQSVHAGTVAVQ